MPFRVNWYLSSVAYWILQTHITLKFQQWSIHNLQSRNDVSSSWLEFLIFCPIAFIFSFTCFESTTSTPMIWGIEPMTCRVAFFCSACKFDCVVQNMSWKIISRHSLAGHSISAIAAKIWVAVFKCSIHLPAALPSKLYYNHFSCLALNCLYSILFISLKSTSRDETLISSIKYPSESEPSYEY